jgi:hypothetical protein|tara:strand:- start:43 stop:486 length:444 start_codon:yes stop_codon:yes gene_type:complete
MATEGDKIQTLLDRMIDLEREPSMEFVGRDVDMKLSYDNWLKKKKGIKRGAHGISGEQHTRFSREWKAYRGIGKGLGNVKEQPAEEVVVEMDPAEQAREELEQAVSGAYKMLDGVDFDAFKTDAEQIQFEQIRGDLIDLIRRMRGPQ